MPHIRQAQLEEESQAQTEGRGRGARRLSSAEWLAVVFALLVVHGAFFRKLIYSADCCDSAGYQALAKCITDHGLFSAAAFSDLRTYGYPLFLSALRLIERFTSIPLTLLSSEFQLGMYLLSAWLLRSEIRRISQRLGQLVFLALCLNVFVLTYAAETLTESLSLTIIVMLGWCWLWSVRVFRSRRWALAAVTGGGLAGFAVMVRPANVFLPVVWVAGQAILVMSRRVGQNTGAAVRRAAVLALTLAAAAAPCVPQPYNNIVFGGAATPLVVRDLGSFQVSTGIAVLKYATGLPPVPTRQIDYTNPLAHAGRVDPDHPLLWYRDNPQAGLETILMHAFAILDQDFIFPYVVDLAPSYRIPVAVLNHVGIGLAVYALWLWIRAARRPGRRRSILCVSLPVVMLYILGVFVIYSVAAPEARFGLPIILLAAPLAATAFSQFWRLRTLRLILLGTAIAAYAAIAIAASGWMRSQSPAISGWEGLGGNLALFRPARQSSTFGPYGPERGVDGIRSGPGVFGGFHTGNDLNPWWEVDLGVLCRLTQVRLFNVPPYARAATVRVLLSPDQRTWTEAYSNGGRPFAEAPLIVPLSGVQARYVRVQLSDRTWLHLDEVE
ncbi:MAG TPA: discoidin domain-containing protein, partial [Bryobacteraceae bacterium]|nr:discoidin domain-containing protein [Bryobacteraceae bacterium]